MNKRRIICIYGLTLVSAVIFFIFNLFPEEKIQNHITVMFNRVFPEYALFIQDARYAFPLAVKLSGVKATRLGSLPASHPSGPLASQPPSIPASQPLGGVVFEADFVRISRPILSLFSSATAFSIKSGAYGGQVKGKVKIMENQASRRVTADMHLRGVRMEKIPAVQELAKDGISGSVQGSCHYDSAAPSDQADIRLNLSDFAIPLALPFFKKMDMNFKTVDLKAALNYPELSVKECLLAGTQLNGRMEGAMTIKQPFGESVLNFSGTIQPHREFLKNFPMQMLPVRKMDKNSLPFKISGIFRRPGFFFQ